MQYCDIKVENETSKEKILHQYVSFSAKKNVLGQNPEVTKTDLKVA